MIEKQFAGKTGALKTSVIGGIKTAAQIMNFMDSSQESALIDSIYAPVPPAQVITL